MGPAIDSDHNLLILTFENVKPERNEIYHFKDEHSILIFKDLSTNTDQFTSCFSNNLSFEVQADLWRSELFKVIRKSFKKVRIRGRQNVKTSEVNKLLETRKRLKMSDDIVDNLVNIDKDVAEVCENENRRIVKENFKEFAESAGCVEN